MRKIAAHYIFLPGYPLLKNGYVTVKTNGEIEVTDTRGVIRELAGLEFYSGCVVSSGVMDHLPDWKPGEALLPRVQAFYSRCPEVAGLALIQGLDWVHFQWLDRTTLTRLL